tara:strand:- start:121 stop:687 length:567 start_codon:yes stop_codon:yes gene_type:complete
VCSENHKDVLMEIYKDKISGKSGHNKSVWSHYEWDGYADSGFDLLVPPCEASADTLDGRWTVAGNTTIKIPLGIKLVRTDKLYYMPDNYQNPHKIPEGRTFPYCVYPRSSISKTPLRLANSVGIIDAGYRGELIAVFDNTSNEPVEIEPYTRLVQACRPDLMPFSVKLVENDFDKTERGSGGFGSTGV